MTTYKVPTVGQLNTWVAVLNRAIAKNDLWLDCSALPPGITYREGSLPVRSVLLSPDCERIEIHADGLFRHPFTLRISQLELHTFHDSDVDWIPSSPLWLWPDLPPESDQPDSNPQLFHFRKLGGAA